MSQNFRPYENSRTYRNPARNAPCACIGYYYRMRRKETVALPPVQVNVVKAVQNDVPLYEDFVAQVYGESDVEIRSRVEGWVTVCKFQRRFSR